MFTTLDKMFVILMGGRIKQRREGISRNRRKEDKSVFPVIIVRMRGIIGHSWDIRVKTEMWRCNKIVVKK